MTDLAELAAATLIGLPSMTPARLRHLIDHFGGPTAALTAVRAGRGGEALSDRSTRRSRARPQDLARAWREQADPAATASVLARRNTHVWIDGTRSYPIPDELPDRPAVLLAEGERPDVLERPRAVIVGTRAATPHGLADARELGEFLADAGVLVVSGMAIGIDGAAHRGAIDVGGPVAGVVATGLDVEYPRRHRVLYDAVRRHGLVISETAYGVRPAPERFPVRNRIIARAGRCGDRGRGDDPRRRPHHRTTRPRLRTDGVGRAGLTSEPRRRRDQCAHRRRCPPTHRVERCAGGPRVLLPRRTTPGVPSSVQPQHQRRHAAPGPGGRGRNARPAVESFGPPTRARRAGPRRARAGRMGRTIPGRDLAPMIRGSAGTVATWVSIRFGNSTRDRGDAAIVAAALIVIALLIAWAIFGS